MAGPRIRPRRSRAKDRLRVYLGVGDFAWPGSGLRSQGFARRFFLDRVAELWPRILEELKREAVSPCRRVLALSDAVGRERIAADQDYPLPADADTLRAVVRAWAKRWHLAAPWVREYALATVEVWAQDVELDEWFPPAEGGTTAGAGEPLTFPGWDPGYERWTDWVARLRRNFRDALPAYRKREEARVHAARMVPNTTKLAAHFVWLARYHVGREDYGPIANDVGQERTTVRNGVRGAAQLIDLKIRDPRKGRPPNKASR
jgi:hypothetical protein